MGALVSWLAIATQLQSSDSEAGSGDRTLGLVIVFLVVLWGSIALLRWVLRRFPEVPLEPPRWSGVDVLALGLSWLLLVISSSFLVSAANQQELFTEAQSQLLQVVLLAGSSVAVAVFVVLTVQGRCGQSLRALGIGTGPSSRGLYQGCLTYLAFLPGVYSVLGIWHFVLTQLGVEPSPQPLVKTFVESIRAGDWTLPIAIALSAVIAAPLFEELFFRAVLFRWLQQHLSLAGSACTSAFVFALGHGNAVALGPIFALGVVLAVAFARTGNLWTCFGLHAAFNSGQFVIMIVLLREP